MFERMTGWFGKQPEKPKVPPPDTRVEERFIETGRKRLEHLGYVNPETQPSAAAEAPRASRSTENTASTRESTAASPINRAPSPFDAWDDEDDTMETQRGEWTRTPDKRTGLEN